MARVVVTASARGDLNELIRTHSLPTDTRERFVDAIRPLANFPRIGPELGGRLSGRRFVLGPWRWMVIVYRWNEEDDLVAILAVADARSGTSPTRDR